MPYNKELYNHIYIRKESNHRQGILNNLHKSVQLRLSTNSSYKYIFDKYRTKYVDALFKSHHNIKLVYITNTSMNTNIICRNRKDIIIWFNPPINSNVKTNSVKIILKLVDKHFKHNPLLKNP